MRVVRTIPMLVAAVTAAVVLWPSRDTLSGKRTVLFTVWGAPWEDTLFKERYAVPWEKQHPEIRVDARRYSDDLPFKYNAWHTRRRGPEVMRIRITDYVGMASRGMLEPLDDYLAGSSLGTSDDKLADVPRHIRELLRVEGPAGKKLYALPEDNAPYGLFYNKAIFKKYNDEHPNDPVQVPPMDGSWTWDDFARAAKKLTVYDPADRSPAPRIAQAGMDFAIWSWPFLTFFGQAGGELWSKDGLTCTVNSRAGVETLEFFRRLQRDDRSFNPSLSGYLSGTGPDALFAAGRTAMLLDGSWRVPNLEVNAPGLDFGVAPLPRGKVPAVVSGCVVWGISSQAKYKKDAWEFLEWLVSPEQALAYWEVLRVAPPASLSALDSPRFQETAGVPKEGGGWIIPPMTREQFADRAAWMRFGATPNPATGKPPAFVPMHPNQTELEEEITRLLNEYLAPTSALDAQRALDRLADHMHGIIDRDREAKGLPKVDRSH